MFDKLKKAFGFGSVDDDDELLRDDPDIEEAEGNHRVATPSEAGIGVAGGVDVDSVVTEIFEHVVEQFNKALPDFLQKSVDPERERRLLYETLSADVKEHLAGLESSVSRRVDATWRSEREKLQADLKSVRQSAKDIEAKRNELKSQQLSAERQKRAMTERIHDLERQLGELAALKEQIELENKSMLNKVKVAAVYEKELDNLRQQMLESESGSDDDAKKQNAELRAELSQLKQTVADLTSKNTDLEHENAGLRKAASRKADDVPGLKAENKALAMKNAELEDAVDDLNNRLERLQSVENDYNSLIGKMEQVEEQLVKIDEMNAAKDARIAALKKQLAETQSALDAKTASAQATEADKPDKQSMVEVSASGKDASRKDKQRRQPEPSETAKSPVSLEDDLLNDTDWIVKPSPKVKNNGGKGKRGNTNRDDGQMSLW